MKRDALREGSGASASQVRHLLEVVAILTWVKILPVWVPLCIGNIAFATTCMAHTQNLSVRTPPRLPLGNTTSVTFPPRSLLSSAGRSTRPGVALYAPILIPPGLSPARTGLTWSSCDVVTRPLQTRLAGEELAWTKNKEKGMNCPPGRNSYKNPRLLAP